MPRMNAARARAIQNFLELHWETIGTEKWTMEAAARRATVDLSFEVTASSIKTALEALGKKDQWPTNKGSPKPKPTADKIQLATIQALKVLYDAHKLDFPPILSNVIEPQKKLPL